MPWQCKLLNVVGTKLVEFPTDERGRCGETKLVDAEGNLHSIDSLPAGTMFYVPVDANKDDWPWWSSTSEKLSDFYREHNSHRQPLMVILPGRHVFLIDGKCWSGGEAYGGWQVTGDAPNITVQPSINIGGSYHGWLVNGVLSDDCEGRQHNELGFRKEPNVPTP